MITDEHRKETVGIAYMVAVASQAGALIQIGDGFFDYGVDLSFKEIGTRKKTSSGERYYTNGIGFSVQAKTTERLNELKTDPEHYSYDLDIENYNDLAVAPLTGAVRKLLVLIHVPASFEEMIAQDQQSILIRHAAYWVDLSNEGPSANKDTQAIRVPKKNLFTPQAVNEFFKRIREARPFND